jgi:hypothetical protein
VAEQVTWGSLLYVPSEWWDYFLFAFFSFMCTPLSSVLYTTDGNVGVQHNVNFIYLLETISMKMDWLVQMMNNLALHSQISIQKSLQTTWYSGNIVFPVGRCQRLGIYALWLFWIHAIDCRMSGHYFMLKVTNCTCWIWIPVLGNHDYHGNVSAQVDQKVTFRDPRWNCHNNFQLIHDLGNTPQGICTTYYEVIVFSLSWNWNSVFVSPLHSGSSHFHLCHFRSWIFNCVSWYSLECTGSSSDCLFEGWQFGFGRWLGSTGLLVRVKVGTKHRLFV